MGKAGDFAEYGITQSDVAKVAPRMMRGEHRSGEMIGERRLANAFGARDQPAVMQPAAPKRIFKLGKRCIVTDWPLHLSRRGEALEPIRLIGERSRGFRLHAHGLKRSVTASQTSSATTASG